MNENVNAILFERDGYQLVIRKTGKKQFELQYRYNDGFVNQTLDRLFPKMSETEIESILLKLSEFVAPEK